MNKIKETLTTMLLAVRYSFSFCWRNSKKETIGRLVVSTASTVVLYLTIQSTGVIINAVQGSMEKFKNNKPTLTEVANSGLLGPVSFLIGVLLLGIFLGKMQWFYRNRWSQKLRFANQSDLNDHRATLDVARFRSKEFDDLQKRISELPSSWQTRIWFSDEMFILFTTMISFVLFGASLLWYKPIYALVLVVVALPMTIVAFRLVAMWWSLFQELVPEHKRRYVLERPYNAVVPFIQAKMFNQMPELRKGIDIHVGNILDGYDRLSKIVIKKEILTHFFAVAGLCGVIVHAIWSTVAYAGEIGTLTIVMAAARTFQGNLGMMVSLIAEQWNSAKGVILIEKDFLGLKPIIKTENPVTPAFGETPPLIRFDKVSFVYPNADTLALKDVSFEIKPGEKVAIVGKSGNGKSTIQALLMRHYDPTSGSIYANGINLCNIEPSSWNEVASALTQEFRVIERHIGEEIASSRLDQQVDLEVVATSSRFANFDEVVEDYPEGYNSQIGTAFGGVEFSGGEQQRLALARVHFRGTPILILDEPDAKLDPESAQKIIDNVFALRGITVVIITHHVSRAKRCDNIIVMGKGEVAEEGNHDDLMAMNGVYKSMYEKDKERLGSDSSDL